MSPAHVEQLLSELQQLGVAHPGNKKKPCLPRICVRGHGQLSTYVRRMLSIEDVQLIEEKDVRKRECTLMVIADTIVPDPVLIRHLMENNQPFLLCSLVDIMVWWGRWSFLRNWINPRSGASRHILHKFL